MKSDIHQLANRAGVIPTTLQTSLLKACLLSGEPAIRAFEQWLADLPIDVSSSAETITIGLPQVYDQLDLGSQRLLSLLYKNLTNQGYKHPVIQKLSGYYKYVWYRNNLLKAKLAAVLSDFQSIGVDLMVLKGTVQIEKYYPDYGMRPTIDLDLAIRPADMTKATYMLVSKGWNSRLGDPYRILTSQSHAQTFYDSSQFEVDLHVNFSGFTLMPSTEEIFWKHSTRDDEGYSILSPAHELFITILHAYQWQSVPPVRWVADSVKLISCFDEHEWSKFYDVIESEKFNVHNQAFHYLIENNLVRIPDRVMHLLEGKRMPAQISTQIALALTSPEINAFAGAQRMVYKIRYKYQSTITGRLKAWLDHYVWSWETGNYFGIIAVGFRKVASKGLYQSKQFFAKRV
jgi:hypothetical protein